MVNKKLLIVACIYINVLLSSDVLRDRVIESDRQRQISYRVFEACLKRRNPEYLVMHNFSQSRNSVLIRRLYEKMSRMDKEAEVMVVAISGDDGICCRDWAELYGLSHPCESFVVIKNPRKSKFKEDLIFRSRCSDYDQSEMEMEQIAALYKRVESLEVESVSDDSMKEDNYSTSGRKGETASQFSDSTSIIMPNNWADSDDDERGASGRDPVAQYSCWQRIKQCLCCCC